MKTNTQRILLIWLLFAAMVFFSACTPQQRLNHLLKKHPELITHDTIYKTKIVTIPEEKADTSAEIKIDTLGLDSVIKNAAPGIDTASTKAIEKSVTKWIKAKQLLKDTLRLDLKHGGYAIVWQQGKQIKLKLYLPAYEIKVPYEAVINKVEAKPQNFIDKVFESRIFKVLWFLFPWIILIFVIRHNRNSR